MKCTKIRNDIHHYWKTDRFILSPVPEDDDPAAPVTYKQDIVLTKALGKARRYLTNWADSRIASSPEALLLTAYRVLLEKAVSFIGNKGDAVELIALYRLVERLSQEIGPGADETAVERHIARLIWETHVLDVEPIANKELSIPTVESDTRDIYGNPFPDEECEEECGGEDDDE